MSPQVLKNIEEEEEIVIDHGEGYLPSEGMSYCMKVFQRILEHGMASFFLYQTFNHQWTWFTLILGFLLGNLGADVISVVVHFTLDNYFTPKAPLIGSTVHYFREHHIYPKRMVGKSFIDTNSEICVAGLLLCSFCFGLQSLGYLNSALSYWTIGWCAIISTFINTIHCYTHMPLSRTPWFYRFFTQTIPFFVSPQHHKAHHMSLNSHYSLYLGKMDLLFDFFYILESAEIIIFVLFGAVPEAGRARQYITMNPELPLTERFWGAIIDLKAYMFSPPKAQPITPNTVNTEA